MYIDIYRNESYNKLCKRTAVVLIFLDSTRHTDNYVVGVNTYKTHTSHL